MTPLLSGVFIASLVGSLHCAGMCGPFVAFATLSPLHRKGLLPTAGRVLNLQIAYQGGRLFAYLSLGALAGLLGATLDFGSSLLGAGRVAGVAAGVLLIASGLARVLALLGLRLPATPRGGFVQRWVNAGQAAAARLSPLRRALAVGVLTAVLPCGWLYAFVAVAAGTGQAVLGALVLLFFWGGSVPMLVGIGAGLKTLLLRAGRRFQLAVAIAVMLLGVQSIIGRYQMPAERVAAPTTSLDAARLRLSLLLGRGPQRCH